MEANSMSPDQTAPKVTLEGTECQITCTKGAV